MIAMPFGMKKGFTSCPNLEALRIVQKVNFQKVILESWSLSW
jgi:hypothetical protein